LLISNTHHAFTMKLAHSLIAATMLGAGASSLAAQALPVPSDNSKLRAALDTIKAQERWTLDQQVSICEIAAPPYKEAARAAEYRRRLQALGLSNVRIDSVGNVIAERRGTGSGPTVLIQGHLDTVFPEGTNVKVKRNGTALAGPGIGDDCRGLAVVLSVVRAFQRARVQTAGTVYFVGNVGEEGQGNLRGTRYLFANSLKGKVDYFISVDGTGLDLKHHGVGSKRYRITYKGPGGHSYGAFGIPNPIHALGRAIAGISEVQVPTTPKTTFNVGVISGGTSVNSIPFSGTMDLDMRSETAEALDAVDQQILKILGNALDAENDRWIRQTGARAERAKLSMEIDTIGLRPANSTQTDASPIVATAIAAGRALGFTPKSGASSTDANLPMSLGVPAITIDGGGSGSGAHSLGETYDDGPSGYLGPQWAALLVAALAGVR
jgi:acetylornithine deacetylase/succinyl-diaminopimelate desuccinylase-like protein